ncbi:MAG: hypothetical protein JNM71_15715 [Flavobacterium lindanitolerans]|uniref:hypothetical protein n=1 Tax=Flavobacterium lindanitolerans TaxID=428988 RepID=UPI001A4F4029|nr:hypothetical protein [Flavobacterium lindanitolerans]MBL7869463.1 hypothetical protein [Flavobacterium lindanitolerans]
MNTPIFKKLNNDFDADPNAPDPKISLLGNHVVLSFSLNSFLWDNVSEGETGTLTFLNCLQYRLGKPDSDSYHRYRYYQSDVEYFDFYLVENSTWIKDFPIDKKIHNSSILNEFRSKLKHFVFFFRDNTFECVATGYSFGRVFIDASGKKEQVSNFIVSSTSKDNYCRCSNCGKTIAEVTEDSMIPTFEECYKSGAVPVPNFGWLCSQICANEYEEKYHIKFVRTKEGKVDYYFGEI